MPVAFLKSSDTWKKIKRVYFKKNGNWTAAATAYLKKSGVWVKVFVGEGPSLNSSPTITPRLGGKTFDIYDSTNGSWDGATIFTRQWVRSDEQTGPFVNISGATSSAYTTTSSDDGKWITVTVRASDGTFFNEANATPVKIVKYAPVSLSSSGGYYISVTSPGSPQPGQTVGIFKQTDPDWKNTTDRTNDTSPSTFEYEWKWEDTGAIRTAYTSSTYLISNDDLTHKLSARIKATNSGGSTLSAWATPTGTIAVAPVIVTAPSWKTTGVQIGDTIIANTGTYSPAPEKVYWMWQYYSTVQSAWTPIYTSTGGILGGEVDQTDDAHNIDHTAVIPARFYSSDGSSSVTSVGKLIRLVSDSSIGSAVSLQYSTPNLGPITAVVESVANRVPTAVSNIYRRVDGTWTAFATATTNATIDWVNTRIRNTNTQGTAKHTFFTTTGADLTTDFFNSIGDPPDVLTQTSYRFGIQAVATGNYTGDTLYSIGVSDEGSYSENTSNINPQFPSRPTGFTATRISNSRIDLAWNAAGGSPTNYQLYYQFSDYSDIIDKTTTADFELGNVTSSSRTGLSANTEYWWWVRSKNATGVSNWSVGRSATTDPNPTTTTAAPTTTTTTAAPTTTTAAPTTTTAAPTTTTAAPTTTTAAPVTPVFTTSTPTRSKSGRTLSMAWTTTITNVSFLWWNTRLRNTSTQANVKHTIFEETTLSDSYTNVVDGTFVLGVQGAGTRNTNSTRIYTIGTSDEGSYRESSSVVVP